MTDIASVQPKRIGWVLGIILFGFAVMGTVSFFRSFAAPIKESRAAYDFFSSAVASARRGEFENASRFFEESGRKFFAARTEIDAHRVARRVPLVGRELRSASEMLSVGAVLAKTASETSVFARDLAGPFVRSGASTISSLTPEMRREFLSKLYASPPFFYGARAEIRLARQTLENLPGGVFTFVLGSKLAELSGALDLAGRTLDDALPLIELFPKLAGYPEAKTYLFLLQNNTELRPSGGFIGTYGILKVKDGHITDFFTDDSYNLDRFVDAKKRPPTPAPLQKYLHQDRWYFRDANWSPDFAESARTALRFYKEEGGAEEPHGVLAVTPDVVLPFLRAIGPVTVEGQTFAPEDFVDTLEYRVEVGFAEAGIPRPQRKAIISVLAHELLARFYAIPMERLPSLIGDLRRVLDEKHFLIYSDDADLQQFAESRGWTGRVEPAAGDYLLAVDANLASLKSDPVVDRKMDYRLSRQGEDLVASAKITYTNRGEFSWKTTRYRTYTRLYAPRGSVLREVRGAMVKEKDPAPGTADVGEELGKTVFGAFISIEPGETRSLEFIYVLPASVKDQLAQKSYTLLAQKQAGVGDRDLTVRLDFGTKVREWTPAGLSARRIGNAIEWRTPLKKDQIFSVNFE